MRLFLLWCLLLALTVAGVVGKPSSHNHEHMEHKGDGHESGKKDSMENMRHEMGFPSLPMVFQRVHAVHLCEMKPEEENCTARAHHCMRWLNIGMANGQDFLPADVCEPDQEECRMMHMKCLHLLTPAEGTPPMSPATVICAVQDQPNCLERMQDCVNMVYPSLGAPFVPPAGEVMCHADDEACIHMINECRDMMMPFTEMLANMGTDNMEPMPEEEPMPEGEPMPEHMPGEHMPEHMSEGEHMPEHMPGHMPEGEHMPEHMPEGEHMPEHMPGHMPGHMPEHMPGHMPEHMPGHMPEGGPMPGEPMPEGPMPGEPMPMPPACMEFMRECMMLMKPGANGPLSEAEACKDMEGESCGAKYKSCSAVMNKPQGTPPPHELPTTPALCSDMGTDKMAECLPNAMMCLKKLRPTPHIHYNMTQCLTQSSPCPMPPTTPEAHMKIKKCLEPTLRAHIGGAMELPLTEAQLGESSGHASLDAYNACFEGDTMMDIMHCAMKQCTKDSTTSM